MVTVKYSEINFCQLSAREREKYWRNRVILDNLSNVLCNCQAERQWPTGHHGMNDEFLTISRYTLMVVSFLIDMWKRTHISRLPWWPLKTTLALLLSWSTALMILWCISPLQHQCPGSAKWAGQDEDYKKYYKTEHPGDRSAAWYWLFLPVIHLRAKLVISLISFPPPFLYSSHWRGGAIQIEN